MKWVKLGAAALNQTPLAWENNQRNICEAIRIARNEGVSLLCLPELCLTGYGCEDAFYAPTTTALALQSLEEILPQTQGILVTLGLPLRFDSQLYNTSCLVGNGTLFGFVAKQFLARDGVHYEPR